MTTEAQSSTDPTASDQLVERLFGALLGTVDVLSVYLGDRLGYYRSLVADGPATAGQLAERTGTHPRYAREWLEQQAVTGLLSVEADGDAEARVFAIPEASREVFTDESSLNYLAYAARMFASVGPNLPHLLDAYRTGGGVSWEQLGPDAREAQSDQNRPWFDAMLADALAGVPDLHEALSEPGARILDVGCGGGWSTINLKRAYPTATLVGVDIDVPSIELARANAAQAGVEVDFRHGDGAAFDGSEYDAAFAFECIHDMPRPVEVLAAARAAIRPGGCMVVMDEAVAETFAPDGDELERLMYGFSLLVCLPDSMSSPPSVATGTVMRPAQLQAYAEAAGFTGFEILPIEGFAFFRFYRLT